MIATGHTRTLRAFVEEAFRAVGLDWTRYVVRDDALARPADIAISRANPARAAAELGWSATMLMPDVVAAMVQAEQVRSSSSS